MRRPRGRPPRTLEAFAAGKVNIGWSVGDLRPDGYHDVAGTMQTVSVLDRLSFVVHDDPGAVRGTVRVDVGGAAVGLEVKGTDDLTTEDNLVLAAARTLADSASPMPTSITLDKRIPVGAGLGGGSADAAAALTALSLAWAADLSARDLIVVAARVGSDVAPILVGGLVHASGRGERVRVIGCARGCRFVLGISGTRLRSADVYRRLDELREGRAVGGCDWFHGNDLEAAARSIDPGLDAGIGAMTAAGAAPVFVSGSGPTVVGVVADAAQAEAVADRARPSFRRVLVTEPTPWGVRLVLRGRTTDAPRPEH